jgi:thiamine pyrophosphokinase
MRTCHIVSALPVALSLEREDGDLVIAADAGYENLRQAGIRPDLVVGDFDSLGYVPKGQESVVYPARKDDTDTMLAVRIGLNRGYRRFLLYGALGGRMDHTLANLQCLSFIVDHGGEGYLLGDEMMTVAGEARLLFPEGLSGIFSVFAWGCSKASVRLEGCSYPYEGELSSDYPLGVSNEFIAKAAAITVTEGKILVIWDTEGRTYPRLEHFPRL